MTVIVPFTNPNYPLQFSHHMETTNPRASLIGTLHTELEAFEARHIDDSGWVDMLFDGGSLPSFALQHDITWRNTTRKRDFNQPELEMYVMLVRIDRARFSANTYTRERMGYYKKLVQDFAHQQMKMTLTDYSFTPHEWTAQFILPYEDAGMVHEVTLSIPF